MNGISFLIAAVQDYDKVFSNFTNMMERIAAFLQRLNIYLDSRGPNLLDKRLRKDTYAVLHLFMMILSESHKLATSRSHRLKLKANILFFNEDGGARNYLAKLETKIADVSRTEITVILQSVSEAARNLRTVEEKVDRVAKTASRTDATTTRIEATAARIDLTTTKIEASATRTDVGVGQLLADQDRRTAKDQSELNKKTIKEVLKPNETSPWWESHMNHQNRIIKRTGDWLLHDHQSFQRWANPQETAANVLSISGKEGYGKSSLCSAIVQWLLEKYPKGRNEHRVAVAYYFFERDAKKKASVNQAIRDILWQLTQYDSAYEAVVGPTCGTQEDTSKTLDLWKSFIDDNGKKVSSTFYVILEANDEPESDPEQPLAAIIQSILSTPAVKSQLQVRILVSGRPSGLETLGQDSGETIAQIALGSRPGSDDAPPNQADILS